MRQKRWALTAYSLCIYIKMAVKVQTAETILDVIIFLEFEGWSFVGNVCCF